MALLTRKYPKLTLVEAVRLIVTVQCLPVLAHPAETSNPSELVEQLKSVGLIGLEVFYDRYSSDTISKLLVVAKEYGLVPTGGSDFHGLDGESIKELPEIALP